MEHQIFTRFAGIGHVFPGYTREVILDLPYEYWVTLALAYDQHVEELRELKNKTR